MIMQFDFITPGQVDEAIAAVRRKALGDTLAHLRFDSFAEGRAAQLLHIGPYSAEAPNIERLHAVIAGRRPAQRQAPRDLPQRPGGLTSTSRSPA